MPDNSAAAALTPLLPFIPEPHYTDTLAARLTPENFPDPEALEEYLADPLSAIADKTIQLTPEIERQIEDEVCDLAGDIDKRLRVVCEGLLYEGMGINTLLFEHSESFKIIFKALRDHSGNARCEVVNLPDYTATMERALLLFRDEAKAARDYRMSDQCEVDQEQRHQERLAEKAYFAAEEERKEAERAVYLKKHGDEYFQRIIAFHERQLVKYRAKLATCTN